MYKEGRLKAASLLVVLCLAACGGEKAAKNGQALASINGVEITALQLNEELQRSGLSPEQAQKPAVTKQLLDSLVERQLVLNQAVQDKVDRDPQVVRAIERAKALLIVQAYMQKKIGSIAKPTSAEVEEYYKSHPGFFAQRKVFEMRQLLIASSDLDEKLKSVIDNAKSLEDVAAYMDTEKVRYARGNAQRSSSDLPAELVTRLLSLKGGQLFLVNEGARSVLAHISDVKDAPLGINEAAPQIEQFLVAQKNKEAAAAELARLRGAAKIEYLNKEVASLPANAADAASKASATAADANVRGVAGLK